MEYIEVSRLANLKEQFVRNRFAEEDFFGREDVEEWLGGQRMSEKADLEVTGWFEMLKFVHKPGFTGLYGNKTIDLLHELAFPSDELVIDDKTKAPFHYIDSIDFHIAVAGSKEIYLNRNSLLVCRKNKPKTLIFTPGLGNGGTYTHQFLMVDVFESALVSWHLLGTENDRGFKAREYLCNWLQKCIDKVRETAEKDFDRAVAVSKDGKKIVTADFVLEVYDGMVCRVSPASRFTERKILRDENIFRPSTNVIITGRHMHDDAMADVLPYVAYIHEQSFFVVKSECGKEKRTYFIVHC